MIDTNDTARLVLVTALDISDRTTSGVVVTYEAPDEVRVSRLEYIFRNAGHRARAKDFAELVRAIPSRRMTGAAVVVALSTAAMDALAPLARGELAFAAELITKFPG